MKPVLSYFLSTYNKLPYLKIVLDDLIRNKKQDEEIVVADGGSNDGTHAHLQQLLDKGDIDNYVSERDSGEAHGTNKAILLCRGDLLKLITDDDVFDYNQIQKQRLFMLSNKEIDIVGSNIGYITLSKPSQIEIGDFCKSYKEWKEKKIRRFWFNGQVFMQRRSSIAYTGLFSTSIKIIDTEFSMRVTSLPKIRLAWMDAVSAIRIEVPESNLVKFSETIDKNTKEIFGYYRMKDELYEAIAQPAFSQKVKNRINSAFGLQQQEPEKNMKIATPYSDSEKVDYPKMYEFSKAALNGSLSELFSGDLLK